MNRTMARRTLDRLVRVRAERLAEVNAGAGQAVFDRRATLLTLDHPDVANVGLPVTLLVEHPGYSSVQAAVFEQLWVTAAPHLAVRPAWPPSSPPPGWPPGQSSPASCHDNHDRRGVPA